MTHSDLSSIISTQRVAQTEISSHPPNPFVATKKSSLARISKVIPSNTPLCPRNAASPIRGLSKTRCLAVKLGKCRPKEYPHSEGSSLDNVREAIYSKLAKKKLELPVFSGKSVLEGQILTIVLHGTRLSQDIDQIITRIAVDAGDIGEVIVLNGLGTSEKTTKMHRNDFVAQAGCNSQLLKSHGLRNWVARNVRQTLMGSGIVRNAHHIAQILSRMQGMPESINLVGHSRGGVTATVFAAMLEAALYTSGALHIHPKMNTALFDPVAGFGKNGNLYSRDILANNPHYNEKNTIVFISATDPRKHFSPQKGLVSEQSDELILTGTHGGIEGLQSFESGNQHHRDVSLIAERIASDILGLESKKRDGEPLSNVDTLKSSLRLAAVQKDILARVKAKTAKSFNPSQGFRHSGKMLFDEIQENKLSSQVFVCPQVKDIFAKTFPQHAKVFAAMESAEARGGRAMVQPLCETFDQTSSAMEMFDEYADLINDISQRIKAWANVQPKGQYGMPWVYSRPS